MASTTDNAKGPQILVINCGSSSVKYGLFAMASERRLVSGAVERIGERASFCRHRFEDGLGINFERPVAAPTPSAALAHIAEILRGVFERQGSQGLNAIGHRVVHGGERFTESAAVDSAVIAAIRDLIPLAPLHNPANLAGIEACCGIFQGVPQVAVFDTAFHQTLPPHAYRYAVPDGWYRSHGVRRYGFHGTSHRYVAERAADYLKQPLESLKVIVLHLGNGASASAVRYGQCIDTSMGFTPLEGLVMGTRCGDLDAAVPLFLESALGQSAEALQAALNRDSGLKGLCGSNDLREVLAWERHGNARAKLALDIFCYRIKKYIGAYFVALEGLDALVFTGGIGENAASIRSRVCTGLQTLGIALDRSANNDTLDRILEIGDKNRPVRVLAVRTDEELQIARESQAVLAGRI